MAGDAQAEWHVTEVCDIPGCEVLEVAAILGLQSRPTLRSRVALHYCMPSLLEDADAWVSKAEVSRGLKHVCHVAVVGWYHSSYVLKRFLGG